MSQPLVTVYVTNYNYGRYLKQAIASVLSQSLQDFELLVIDDGSTDDSHEVLADMAEHPKIEVIYQKNRGLNVTNNIALRASRGKYIVRLDADDYFEPDALQCMTDVLESDPDIGLVFPDYYVVDHAGGVLEAMHRLDFGKDVTLRDQPAHGACTMIRADYLRAVGGYNESYRCQDGYELWIKFATRFKVANINRPLFHYRQHGDNLTGNESRILETRMLIKEDFLAARQITPPSAVAVVPLRRTRVGGQTLAEVDIAGESLLKRKLDALAGTESVIQIVVTSDDAEMREIAQPLVDQVDHAVFVQRSAAAARRNSSLFQTVREVVSSGVASADVVMTTALEYPFVSSRAIQDAINTLAVFDADAVISVRPDTSSFYQHHGSGMVPILDQDKTTKLEREALYRSAGGVIASRIAGCLDNGKLLHGKVGHVVVSQRAAFGIQSEFDLEVATQLRPLEPGGTAKG